MSAVIPTVFPHQLVAGDTLEFKIGLGDFPADQGWTLSLSMIRRTGGVRIISTAAADGVLHHFTETATTTAGWLPGIYDTQSYVTSATERHLVWQGVITIHQNYAVAENGMDTRTQARKIFDALEQGILTSAESRATSASAGAITEWQVEGLRIKKGSTDELIAEMTRQRDRYAAIVRNEEMKAARLAGRGTGQKILVRFT